jgi:sigma-B regulation protein RsbU (phosphoserine phosphatase)
MSVPGPGLNEDVRALLVEVDAALVRLDTGTYGVCERCHDPVESDRLAGDPLARVCLGCLSDSEKRALERDLELAGAVQRRLLPPDSVLTASWEIEHRYRPLGTVSGDYCDVLDGSEALGATYVVLGDVSGKGLSSSLLMAHLQAVFHSLAGLDLAVEELARRANLILCERSAANMFSTLLLAKLWPDGSLELCNAGHEPPILMRGGEIATIPATGLPLGLFRESEFRSARFRLERGDALLLYTDGLSEATDGNGTSYGLPRVEAIAHHADGRPAADVLDDWLGDLDRFRNGAARTDDLTLLMVRRR